MARASVAEQRAAWILLSPFMLAAVVFFIYPLIQSARLATSQSFGAGATRSVGMANFESVLTDPIFWVAVSNTVILTAASLFVVLPMSLGLALLLNRPRLRGRALYRLVIFMPQMVGVVFGGFIATVFFAKDTGFVNQALTRTPGVNALLERLFGFDIQFPWLDRHVLLTIFFVNLWLWVGFNMVYFLAALQSVDKSLIEAAKIDGAGPLSRFRAVTMPAIKSVTTFVFLLAFIGSMQLFELPYLMLNGDPPQSRGVTIVWYLYQQGFEIDDLGMASAVGWLLGVVLIGAAVAQFASARREAKEARL
jgi:ABC-type sugar transport system permease subunit